MVGVALRGVPQSERSCYPVMKFLDQVTLFHPPCNFLWAKVGVPSKHICQKKRLV